MHFCSIFTKISVFILLGAVHHTESIMIPLKKITLVITFQQNNGAEPAASCLRLCANGTESKSASVKESFGKRPRMHQLLRAASCRSRFAACLAHTSVRAAAASKSASVKECSSKDREYTCFYGRQVN